MVLDHTEALPFPVYRGGKGRVEVMAVKLLPNIATPNLLVNAWNTLKRIVKRVKVKYLK